jgi:hypothetical protein
MQRGASFAGGPNYFGPGAPSIDAYELKLWAVSTPALDVADGDSVDTIYANNLPMGSLGSTTLMACGNQSADCSACDNGGM